MLFLLALILFVIINVRAWLIIRRNNGLKTIRIEQARAAEKRLSEIVRGK